MPDGNINFRRASINTAICVSKDFIVKTTQHIKDELFDRYAARKAAATEILRLQTHVADCEVCRGKLANVVRPEKTFATLDRDFVFDDFEDAPEHLSYEQLEFFVDGKLDAVDREIATSHLAICAECTNDLTDLHKFREIAVAPAVNLPPAATPRQSIWQKIFAFDSIKIFAPVAAILLIAVLFGALFLLRPKNDEIAQSNKNQNVAPSNVNLAKDMSNVVAPPSPEISPSPAENLPKNETLYALNDGQLKVDEKGNVAGAENLSPAAQNLIRQSLQNGKITVANHSFGAGGGVLMGENNAENGVPFALETPIGKVIRENQPILRWKPLKDAQSYSAAIVDEKFNVVAESGKLTTTNWKPSKPLPRGANYSWQVTATKADGTETVSPSSPAPQARFRVIEQNLYDDINQLEKSANRSHFALGVLYAKAGLKQEARSEFEKLVKENPNSPLARKLLQSVR